MDPTATAKRLLVLAQKCLSSTPSPDLASAMMDEARVLLSDSKELLMSLHCRFELEGDIDKAVHQIDRLDPDAREWFYPDSKKSV